MNAAHARAGLDPLSRELRRPLPVARASADRLDAQTAIRSPRQRQLGRPPRTRGIPRQPDQAAAARGDERSHARPVATLVRRARPRVAARPQFFGTASSLAPGHAAARGQGRPPNSGFSRALDLRRIRPSHAGSHRPHPRTPTTAPSERNDARPRRRTVRLAWRRGCNAKHVIREIPTPCRDPVPKEVQRACPSPGQMRERSWDPGPHESAPQTQPESRWVLPSRVRSRGATRGSARVGRDFRARFSKRFGIPVGIVVAHETRCPTPSELQDPRRNRGLATTA